MAERLLGAATRWRTGLGLRRACLRAGPAARSCAACAVPHELGLAGHSDADVAFHALTDAILGTIGAGDIGTHFPPSDPRWRDADSAPLPAPCGAAAGARGGPDRERRPGDRLRAAEDRAAPGGDGGAHWPRCSACAPDQVSIKATTSERLGFTGRGEGIAAQAVVSVALEG